MPEDYRVQRCDAVDNLLTLYSL